MSSDYALADDLAWGAAAIACEIGLPIRQTFYCLEAGLLPACKVGRRWVGSKRALRAYLSGATTIPEPPQDAKRDIAVPALGGRKRRVAPAAPEAPIKHPRDPRRKPRPSRGASAE